MAVTPVRKKVWVAGDRKEVIIDVTFDNSYVNAGGGNHGMALTPAQMGLDELSFLDSGLLVKSDFSSAFYVGYDFANNRIQAFKSNGTTDLTPVANAVDLSTYTVRLRAVGKGPASA